MVTNLLDLGRIDAGVGLQVEKTLIMDIVKAVMDPLQLIADQKEIELVQSAEPGLPESIEADRALLQQALFNLVENAIKYTPAHGSVALRIKVRPQGLQFEVQDSGIGIARWICRASLRSFSAAASGSRAQRGSGLGLAIVRSIAEQHAARSGWKAFSARQYLLPAHPIRSSDASKKKTKLV